MFRAAEHAMDDRQLLEEALARSMAGYTACRLGKHKLAVQQHKDNLDLLNAFAAQFEYAAAAEVEAYVVLRVVTLYNLAVESMHLYLRQDACNYISLAGELAEEMQDYVLLKYKVRWVQDELGMRTSIQEAPPEPIDEPAEASLNFLPGGPQQQGDNKLVEVRCESPIN